MINYLELISSYSDLKIFNQLDGGVVFTKTYGDFLKDIKAYAYELEKQLGNVSDKRIGVLANSEYSYVVLLFAIIFSRGVAVPINEKESEKNIQNVIKNSGIDAVVLSEQFDKSAFSDITVIDMKLLIGGNEEKELADFREDEKEKPALIIYTSGTTSLSKGAVLSAGSLFGGKREGFPKECLENCSNKPYASVYSNFPFYHVGALIGWLEITENGHTFYFSKDSGNVLSDLENIRIDFASVTPAVLKLWAKCVKRNRIDRLGGVKLILTAGAPLDSELVKSFAGVGITVGQFYGQTETGGTISSNYDMINHPGSVGKVNKDVSVSFIDGEICVDFWGNMIGYDNNPEETAKCLADGVVHTGDLGYLDDDGYLYLTGRKKTLIILSGGENVSPEEIEGHLYENKQIKECLVFAKNDRICAEIYAPELTFEEVKAYVDELNKNVPIYKRIYNVELRDCEFEKTSVGKIKRKN